LEAFYKLEVPYSRSTEERTLENFVNNEARVRTFLNDEGRWSTPQALELLSGAALLCRYVFEDFDPDDIIPRHGPGSLASGEIGEEKWKFSTIYEDLHKVYPYYRTWYHSSGMLFDLFDEYALGLKSLKTGTSKVTLVPKDSRGPRIITMEPLEYMWHQQGLGRKMMWWLENHSLTRGHINFTDQSVNQYLAQISSLSNEWATLDMKDASDLLSVDAVKLVFRSRKSLLKSLLVLRTPDTVFPNGEGMRLKKFAGMGSALCFPVESFIFWAICVSEVARQLNIGLRDATQFCYVFGDDIIVPTDLAEDVIVALESVGLMVNRSKSYITGPFRESCGVDAFLSVNVTPTRFKKLFPETSTDGTALAAWCSYANTFARKGYTLLANTIFTDLEKVFGKIPYGVSTSPYPCRIVDDPFLAEDLNQAARFRMRVSEDYHRKEFKVLFLVPVDQPSTLDGWARLTRNLLIGPGDEPSRFVLPKTVKIVKGWRAV
jgi:hypothetical protein